MKTGKGFFRGKGKKSSNERMYWNYRGHSYTRGDLRKSVHKALKKTLVSIVKVRM